MKAGREERTIETIQIGAKTTTARGNRYLTLDVYERQVAAGMLKVIEEDRDKQASRPARCRHTCCSHKSWPS